MIPAPVSFPKNSNAHASALKRSSLHQQNIDNLERKSSLRKRVTFKSATSTQTKKRLDSCKEISENIETIRQPIPRKRIPKDDACKTSTKHAIPEQISHTTSERSSVSQQIDYQNASVQAESPNVQDSEKRSQGITTPHLTFSNTASKISALHGIKVGSSLNYVDTNNFEHGDTRQISNVDTPESYNMFLSQSVAVDACVSKKTSGRCVAQNAGQSVDQKKYLKIDDNDNLLFNSSNTNFEGQRNTVEEILVKNVDSQSNISVEGHNDSSSQKSGFLPSVRSNSKISLREIVSSSNIHRRLYGSPRYTPLPSVSSKPSMYNININVQKRINFFNRFNTNMCSRKSREKIVSRMVKKNVAKPTEIITGKTFQSAPKRREVSSDSEDNEIPIPKPFFQMHQHTAPIETEDDNVSFRTALDEIPRSPKVKILEGVNVSFIYFFQIIAMTIVLFFVLSNHK